MSPFYAPTPEDEEQLEEECGDSCGIALSERVCEQCDEVFIACYDHERWVQACELCREE